MRQTGLSLSEIVNAKDMNQYIDYYADMFKVCPMAAAVDPAAKLCTTDCPFTRCAEDITFRSAKQKQQFIDECRT